MAWIELHQSLVTHRKIMKLKRLLNIRTPMAIGYLCMIWLWSLDNAPDGDLSTLTPREIASLCDYRGKDPKALISALIEAGFLNSDLSIHDWFDYTGKLITSRNLKRKRDRDYYNKKKNELEIPLSDSSATVPYTKEQNTKEEYSTEDNSIEDNTKKSDNFYLERVDELFSVHIHKTTNAEKLHLSALLDEFDYIDVRNAIIRYSDRARSVSYIEKILRNDKSKKEKESSFDIDNLDKIIRSM